MSTTATNYINLIKKDYPVRGRDNDSQGFRDNFTNITEALRTINQDVTDLGNIAVLSNSTATFFGNTVEDANFQNCSTELWDNGSLSGNITVDFTLGSYQKLTVESGVNNISIVNWPDEGKSGHITLSVYSANNEGNFIVNFVGENVTSLGPSKNPYRLVTGANVFEIYSEYPAGAAANTVHTRLLNEIGQINTVTSQVRTTELILNNPTLDAGNLDGSQNVTYKVSSATGAMTATVVRSRIGGRDVSANLALVPNKVVRTITTENPTGIVSFTTGTKIELNSVEGISPGATFNLVNNTSSFRVINVVTTSRIVECTPEFNSGIGTGSIIFKNPMFGESIGGVQLGEKTAFPTLVTLLEGPEYFPANTSTGRTGVFKGSVYASANTLEVTFAEPGNGVKNTFTASTMPATTITDSTQNLANTMFTHMVLPPGAIIMWYGVTTNIPLGWALCNGTLYDNLTYPGNASKRIQSPDLRNKFVIGADTTTVWNGSDPTSSIATSGILGSNTSTGGTAVAAIVNHNHVSTGTFTSLPHSHEITDPGHEHVLTSRTGVMAGDGIANADIDSDDRQCIYGGAQLIKSSQSAKTSISIANSTTTVLASLGVAHTGTVAENNNTANIPPFQALCYIIKIAG